tara:strand:+ start:1016 stop:2290 length:1275 start_codon:yes stop_codon:yes gene_type:complete
MKRIKKSILRKAVRMALFEDAGHKMATTYGIYDRPGPVDSADEDFDPTVPDEVPLKPTEMMSTSQLATERPPIEDEDFKPDNIAQLSKSAAAIAQLVPAEQIGFFYKELHNLLDSATDNQEMPDTKGVLGDQESDAEKGEVESPDPKSEDEKEVKEETFRRMVREVLLEMLSDDEKREFDEFRGDGYSVTEPDDYDTSGSDRSRNQEGETLEDLAADMGFSGAPGVRQYIDKILKKTQYFALKVKPEDMNKLRDFATGEFIDAMAQSDLLDPEDIVELQQAPQAVNELDSFRFFFVAGFLMPAYQKVAREAKKRIKDQMSAMGIPEKLEQTVLNQVTGSAKRDRKALIVKLERLVKAGEVSADAKADIAKNLDRGFEKLQAAGEMGDDLVQKSMDGWSSMSQQKKAAVLDQALDQTAEFQEKGI